MKNAILFLLFLPGFVKGQYWIPYTPNFPDTIGISDIHLVDENTIWAVGVRYSVNDSLYGFDAADAAYYARSVDGGATWKTGLIPIGSGLSFIANMAATDAQTAYVIGLDDFSNAKTLKTSNGGDTWEVQNVGWDPAASWPDYIYAFAPAKLTAIGDPREGEFEIYYTINGGQFWFKVGGAKIPDPLAGEFGYNNCGAAAGNSIWFGTSAGRIYRSRNSGIDWEAFQTPAAFIVSMDFSDAQHGVVITGSYTAPFYTLVYQTSDGGETWTDVTPAGNAIRPGTVSYIPNSSYIMMSGNTGSLLDESKFGTWVSPDRGQTWQQVDAGTNMGWPTFLSPTVGWAGNAQQLAHKSRMLKYNGSPLVSLLSPAMLHAEVSVLPNPASDWARVTVTGAPAGEYWILVNDAQGRLVQKTIVTQETNFERTIRLSDWPSGVYSVTVAGETGSKSQKITVLH